MSEKKTIVCLRKEGSEKQIWLSPSKDKTANLWAINKARFPDSCCLDNIRILPKALISAQATFGIWTEKKIQVLWASVSSNNMANLSLLPVPGRRDDSKVGRATLSMFMVNHIEMTVKESLIHTRHIL